MTWRSGERREKDSAVSVLLMFVVSYERDFDDDVTWGKHAPPVQASRALTCERFFPQYNAVGFNVLTMCHVDT
jgi:hypothetical protein